MFSKPQFWSYQPGRSNNPSSADEQPTTVAVPVVADPVATSSVVVADPIMASTDEGIVTLAGERFAERSIPAAPDSKYYTAHKPSVRKERLIPRVVEEKLNYSVKSNSVRAKTSNTPQVGSVLSLILGIIGLGLFIAGIKLIALLIGIVGFILSVVGLVKVKKGKIAHSSKGWALVGLLFNSILVLIFLFYLTFFIAYAAS
ncbi:hypothetical protein [Telluribacter humicola]|uniref:hypothetical protein n=1 Tax=Telluribacter humicola TaxID=1720261 RepID=UPI001A97470A|nr:hypothetical protein [Telluribacter humicola]